MQAYSSAAGALEALADRIRSLESDLRESRDCEDTLRHENAELRERLKRRDERIEKLLEEKFGLAESLEQKTAGQAQPPEKQSSTPASQESAAASLEPGSVAQGTTTTDGSEIRKPAPGFTLVPADEDEVVTTSDRGERPDLHEWAAARKPSKVKPWVLSDTPWKLSMVFEDERTAWKVLHQQMVEAEDDLTAEEEDEDEEAAEQNTATRANGPADDGDAVMEHVVSSIEDDKAVNPDTRAATPDPDAEGANKRRRLNPTELESNSEDPASSSPLDTAASDRDTFKPLDKEVEEHVFPFHRRGRDDSRYQRRDFRRKAICVHCWKTSSLCDFRPQCRTCVVDGVQCVRKLCEEGEECENKRCPCLHPGE